MDGAGFRFDFFGGSADGVGQAAAATTVASGAEVGAGMLELVGSDKVAQLGDEAFVSQRVQGATPSVLQVRTLSSSATESAAKRLEGVDPSVTDLVPGRYEGGFTVWECSLDLASLVLREHCGGEGMSGRRVLELGCGHGIPGIVCAMHGASVTFQDFNREVLEHVTVVNVSRNVAQGEDRGPRTDTRVQYLYGPWSRLSGEGALLPAGSFDLILSAETIYDRASVPSLCRAMRHALAPGGVALVAAKVFYFGVGGGVSDFVRVAEAEGFAVREVASYDDGANNMRKILSLTYS